MPLIVVTIFDETTGDCIWNWPKNWMGAANETTWLVLLAIIPLMVMTGLYSRVVYTLWFKRNEGQELAFRQKVRLTKDLVGNNEFLSRPYRFACVTMRTTKFLPCLWTINILYFSCA